MNFSKPSNMRYVDMCKEFDEEFYSPNRDDAKLYKYMYLIYYMFACKNAFFKNFEDYEGYAHYAATTIYIRYLKKWANGERIKSLKNYAESSCKWCKIDYQKSNFKQISNDEKVTNWSNDVISSYLNSSMGIPYYDDDLLNDIEKVLQRIPDFLEEIIKELPFKNELEIKNIYISCLLTFIGNITFSERMKNIVNKRKIKNSILGDNYHIKQLNNQRNKEVILWKLNDSMKYFIIYIINKLHDKINESIELTKNYYDISDDIIEDILLQSNLEG